MDETVEARRNAYIERLIEKHGGDAEHVILEAAWTVIVQDDKVAAMQARINRLWGLIPWGYLRKGNAYKRPPPPPKPEPKPLDVSSEDAPHG